MIDHHSAEDDKVKDKQELFEGVPAMREAERGEEV